jgi:hypothetical protein
MIYKIRNLEIRSQNAAKPFVQVSSHLISYLGGLPQIRAALDYGCGKLRYAEALGQKCEQLTLVDSRIQIERTRIWDYETTVREYALQRWPNSQVLASKAEDVQKTQGICFRPRSPTQ